MLRILIVMSDTGGGHRASAQALQAAFATRFPGRFQVEIVDLWTDYTPWPINRIPRLYGPIVARVLWLLEVALAPFRKGARPLRGTAPGLPVLPQRNAPGFSFAPSPPHHLGASADAVPLPAAPRTGGRTGPPGDGRHRPGILSSRLVSRPRPSAVSSPARLRPPRPAAMACSRARFVSSVCRSAPLSPIPCRTVRPRAPAWA